MARQINGHVGNFKTIAELDAKFAAPESMGCSANLGTLAPFTKVWSDGNSWNGDSSITIFGVANDASRADDNTTRIQNALDAAGLLTAANTEIVVHAPGSCYISRTLEVWSNTKLRTSSGTYLKRITTRATNFCMVHNRGAQLRYRVSGATIVNGYITVIAPGHPFTENTQIYANNWKTNTTLNGFKTLVNVVPGVSFQYSASGSNPSNSATELADFVRSTTIAGSSFVRTSNVTIVAEPGHKRQPGDAVWIAAIPVVAATFNGAVVISDIVDGVSWSYANTGSNETGTGIALVLGDRSIEYDLSIDGSSGSYGYIGAPSNACDWGNISQLTGRIKEAKFTQGGRVCNHFNVHGVRIFDGHGRKNASVLFQFDSYCDKVRVDYAEAEGMDDDLVAWGVTTTGTYTETIPPCGPGNNGVLSVGTLQGQSNTGLFKMYCATGYDLGVITLEVAQGRGSLGLGDPGTGVSGGSFSKLSVLIATNVPTASGGNVIGCSNPSHFGTWGSVYIGTIYDQNTAAINANNTGEAVFLAGALGSITIGKLVTTIARTNSASVKVATSVTKGSSIKVLSAETTCGNGGWVFLARGVVGALQPIETLSISDWTHRGADQNSGVLVYSDVSSAWLNVFINGFNGGNFSKMIGQNTAGLTHNWFLENVNVAYDIGDAPTSGVGADNTGTFNVYMRNCKWNFLYANVLQFGLSQTVRFVGDFTHPAGKAVLPGASMTFSLNAPTVQIDGTMAGLVPQVNDEFWNTNAAFGTGIGRYGRTSAGAWQKIF